MKTDKNTPAKFLPIYIATGTRQVVIITKMPKNQHVTILGMRYHFRAWMLLISFFFTFSATAEELVIVQAISNTKKSFIIRRGFAEGVRPDQEGMFSNSKFSFVARAIEVNRNYSLWRMLETETTVPFEKDQFVYYNGSPEKIEVEIVKVENRKERRRELFFEPNGFWSLRIAYSTAVQSTISNAESDLDTFRQGSQYEVTYHRNFKPNWEWGVGFRVDQETETIEDVSLEVPTTRVFAMGEITYNFDEGFGLGGTFYGTVGAGIGNSSSTVADEIASGAAYVIPNIRVGYQFSNFTKKGFLIEGMLESISATETFPDGTEQEILVNNIKAAIGFKF